MTVYVIMEWLDHEYNMTDKAFTTQAAACDYCTKKKNMHIYVPVTIMDYVE
jgi:hypothetical protein